MPRGPECRTSWSGMSDPVVRVVSMTVIDGGDLDEELEGALTLEPGDTSCLRMIEQLRTMLN